MNRRPLAPVVDLGRERRLRSLDAEADELLAAGGEGWAAGLALYLEDEENRMATHDVAISLRLPADVAERAEALVEPLSQERLLLAAGRGLTRASVLRLAVLEGLDALEAKYAGPKGERR